MSASPWWYRRRQLVIFLIFCAGFWGGWWLWTRLTGSDYLPAFLWAARYVHVDPVALLWAATGATIAGWLLRLWGSSYLTASVVWSADAKQNALLVDGPFRFVRNPLYLGNDLQALGIGALATPIGWAILMLLIIPFSSALARHEATLLGKRYGTIYEAYRAAVPAMIPRLIPARIEGSVRGRPSLRTGLLAEMFTIATSIGMVAIALEGERGFSIFWAAFVLGWLAQTLLRSRTLSRGTPPSTT